MADLSSLQAWDPPTDEDLVSDIDNNINPSCSDSDDEQKCPRVARPLSALTMKVAEAAVKTTENALAYATDALCSSKLMQDYTAALVQHKKTAARLARLRGKLAGIIPPRQVLCLGDNRRVCVLKSNDTTV